jgi:crotonobetainyl-CoA:carnitine CoA-transferase CaiB-like acyl-CoA transferase
MAAARNCDGAASLKAAGFRAFQEKESRWKREKAGGALSGIKIVDLARVLGGPYCTQMLADHGAEAIKIEPPQGDETRDWGPPFLRDGTSAYFSGVNWT